MNPEYLKILPIINKKLKIGLDIRGSIVYSNGTPVNPVKVKEIFDQYYPIYREQFLMKLMLEDYEKEL